MYKYNVGDRVTAGPDRYAGAWQNLTVTDRLTEFGLRKYRLHNHITGSRVGVISEGELTLIDPPKTDQELADEYRALRKKGKLVARELNKRGYSGQFKSDFQWRDLTVRDSDFRFIKTETKTITI